MLYFDLFTSLVYRTKKWERNAIATVNETNCVASSTK